MGTAGADVLTGTSAADVIVGADGNDTIHGAGGPDLICGGNGDDVLYGDQGSNKLDGGAGNDTLTGSPTSVDTLVGGTGIYDIALYSTVPAATPLTADLSAGTATAGTVTDHLTAMDGIVGTPGNDRLTGDAGVNLLFGIAGNDVIDGAGGFDYAGFLVAPVTASLVGGQATGEGSDTLRNVEGLLAGQSPSVLVGDGGPNVLLGAAGDDTLRGGGGADVLGGAAGADTISGDDGDDTLLGGPGTDALTGGAGLDIADYSGASGPVTVNLTTGAAGGADGADTLSQIENATGSAFGDTLTGSAVSNRLLGLAGNDTLVGGGGSDLLDGGGGVDAGNGGKGIDACQSVETATACERILPVVSGARAAAPASVARAAGAITGYIDTGKTPVTCDNVEPGFVPAQMYIPNPIIYSTSGSEQQVTWTPVVFQWDGISQWVQVATGTPHVQNAYGIDDANASIWAYTYGTNRVSFQINQPGYFRAANYVSWNQIPGQYEYDWAGSHQFLTTDALWSSTIDYNYYCTFTAPVSASAVARSTAPDASAALPAPRW